MPSLAKFVVIGGVGRSGTNLTRRILGSHSRISVPPAEPGFFRAYANGRSVSAILSRPRLKDLVDTTDLLSGTHKDAYIHFLVRYAESIGKDIPGEKTPFNEFFYDIARDWLQDFDFKFIHLVRNPFDVMASLKLAPFIKTSIGISDITVESRNWSRSVALGLARARAYPKDYYLLKYEDLATEPVEETKELCDFLEIDFERERMLNLSDFEGHWDNTSFPKERGTSHADYGAIRKPTSRKHSLTASEVDVVSSICGELALAIQYEDEDLKSLRPERRRPPTGFKVKLKQAVGKHMPWISASGGR